MSSNLEKEEIGGKHAFLVMAHSDPYLLEVQVKLLDYSKNDIYIHIDKKSKSKFNLNKIRNSCIHSKIYIFSEFTIHWGHCSQVECEIFLLEKALTNRYQYYHLLSGSDLPIKSQFEIHEFFKRNIGKEFIQFYSNEFSNRKWISLYHLLQKFQKGSKYKIVNMVFKVIEKLSLKFQDHILRINRLDKRVKFQKGATWFSITSEFASYVIERKDWALKTFRFSQSADEIFIQTLLINSRFINNVYHAEFDDDNKSIMRYIDWNRGFPYVFRASDFNDIISSPYLFARKFSSSIDKEIVDSVFSYLSYNINK